MVALRAIAATINASWLTAYLAAARAVFLERQRVVHRGRRRDFVKGSRAVHVGRESERLGAIGIATPASKGGTGRRCGRERDLAILGIVFGAIGATIDTIAKSRRGRYRAIATTRLAEGERELGRRRRVSGKD